MNWGQAIWIACVVGCCALAACSSDRPPSPPVPIFRGELPVSEGGPAIWERELPAGAYRVAVRENGVDFRMHVEISGSQEAFDDEVARHGYKATAVVLRKPAVLRVELSNTDFRDWKGSAFVDVERLRDLEDRPDARELGFRSFGEAGKRLAQSTYAARESSIASFEEAARHFGGANDIAARAEVRYSLASTEYLLRMDNVAAIAAANLARADFESLGNEVGVHEAIMLIAMSDIEIAWKMNAAQKRAEQQALYRSADEGLRLAGEFFERHGMPLQGDVALNIRGIGFLYSGDYERAVPLFEEAVRRAVAMGDTRERTKRASNLAWTHNRLGLFEKSVHAFAEILPLADRERDGRQYAFMLGNYGLSAVAIGEFDTGLAAQAEAHALFLENGMRSEAANALSSIAGIYLRLGDAERAIKTYRLAIADFEVTQDFSAISSAARLAGSACASLGRHEEALRFLRRALEIDGKPVDIARTHVLIARTLRDLGDPRGAATALELALENDNALLRASALDERGRLRLAQGDTRRAIEDFRAADAGFAGLGVDLARIETNTSLSTAWLATGDAAMAAKIADVAIDLESRIRVKSANPEWRASFLSLSYAPYEARIAAELSGDAQSIESLWRAFQIAERVRGRAMSERLATSGDVTGRRTELETLRAKLTAQLGRLESRLQRSGPDDPTALELRRVAEITRAQLAGLAATNSSPEKARALPGSLTEVRKSLPSDVAVLAYFTGDRSTDIWLLTNAELRHTRTHGAAALETEVAAFVSALRKSTPSATAATLGAALLGDLLDGVSAERLVILADGPLNALPFAALKLPGTDEQLVDRFVISMSPSLALALFGRDGGAKRPTRVAVVSDPVYSLTDRRLTASGDETASKLRDATALARLPYSAIEARAVSAAFEAGESIQLSGFDATTRKVLALERVPLRVLHFATHARSNESAEDSALFLSRFASDGSPVGPDSLTADDIAHSTLRADLVVLSGCSTGEGRELRGGGVLGLTHGFLANGTHSVIASLWPIEDASTALFMREFYDAYRGSGRAAQALRIAQLRTRNGPANAVWSSFVVRANELP